MPQASEELRKKWGGKDGVGEDKAYAFLKSKSWTEIGNGMMMPPQKKISHKEYEALRFLVDEWDYGCTEKVLDVASPRGFAALTPEQRKEASAKGGANVPANKRSFSTVPNLANRAGMLGGRSVDPQNRSFSKNKNLAAEAGRKGGRMSQRKKEKNNEQVAQSIEA